VPGTVPDGEPVRFLLLGEQLIAFRDTQGRIGIMDHRCPHRCASLFFGRNEENGIRCVYHGWKYDYLGNCVDQPNLPPHRQFKKKVHAKAYRAAEHNGIVYVYMGDAAKVPPLPDMMEAALLPRNCPSLGDILANRKRGAGIGGAVLSVFTLARRQQRSSHQQADPRNARGTNPQASDHPDCQSLQSIARHSNRTRPEIGSEMQSSASRATGRQCRRTGLRPPMRCSCGGDQEDKGPDALRWALSPASASGKRGRDQLASRLPFTSRLYP
jgi:nitrite reductase/ring-hydroxylating ferredoxin subunit